MAQPQTARITCPQCNAWYDSERDLLSHMGVAHRVGRGKPSFQASEPVVSKQNDEQTGCATSFIAENRDEIGGVCGQSTMDQTGEYVQPEGEKETGGES